MSIYNLMVVLFTIIINITFLIAGCVLLIVLFTISVHEVIW
jgi:hypothetical protein